MESGKLAVTTRSPNCYQGCRFGYICEHSEDCNTQGSDNNSYSLDRKCYVFHHYKKRNLVRGAVWMPEKWWNACYISEISFCLFPFGSDGRLVTVCDSSWCAIVPMWFQNMLNCDHDQAGNDVSKLKGDWWGIISLPPSVLLVLKVTAFSWVSIP